MPTTAPAGPASDIAPAKSTTAAWTAPAARRRPTATVTLLGALHLACRGPTSGPPPDEPASDPVEAPPIDEPPPTGPPTPAVIGAGLAGGWSLDTTSTVRGARFLHAARTDKDGALVAARLASALAGLGVQATHDARAAALDPTRMADARYVDEVATFIVDDLYGAFAHQGHPDQPLLRDDVLVLTSVHRYGLYVAEVLHAPVLPLQFISFATTWEQVREASTRSAILVGQDYDWDALWLWNKLGAGAPGTPAAQLPDAYLRALAAASTVVIVQPDDSWTTCTAEGCADAIEWAFATDDTPVWVHTSLSRSEATNPGTALFDDARAAGWLRRATPGEVANFKQWEWGVPDTTIASVASAWADLGRDPADLVVLRGGVVDLFQATPALWEAYLTANQRPVRGLHFSAYWAAFPQLERCGGALPFPFYTWWTPDWHPLDDAARAALATVCGDAPCPAALARGTRAFVNAIGSADDPTAVRALLADHDLTPARGAWFGDGINALGAAPWSGWSGEEVAPAWEVVADALADPATCVPAAWSPLTPTELCALPWHRCASAP